MGLDIIYSAVIDPKNPNWEKHYLVWETCNAAGVSIPDETVEFFNRFGEFSGGDPASLLEVDLNALLDIDSRSYEGVRIDLSDMPEGTIAIKVDFI